MRRTLYLVRHAKSSWDDPLLLDHDRPLAPRGEKALRPIRAHVERAEHLPSLVICSSAVRASSTLDGIRPALPDDVEIEIDEHWYHAGPSSVVDRLRQVADGIRAVMFVGHNPTIQELALVLAGPGDSAMRQQIVSKLPTGAVVTLTFDGPWRRLAKAHLDELFMPRKPVG